ncbi:hypothetical protein D9M71_436250 [compost metagenome]
MLNQLLANSAPTPEKQVVRVTIHFTIQQVVNHHALQARNFDLPLFYRHDELFSERQQQDRPRFFGAMKLRASEKVEDYHLSVRLLKQQRTQHAHDTIGHRPQHPASIATNLFGKQQADLRVSARDAAYQVQGLNTGTDCCRYMSVR